jgi:hypothetical protein
MSINLNKTNKKNLVIVRSGKDSLHSNWLNQPYCERLFDTIISFYDKDTYKEFKPIDGVNAILQTEGGKWDNIHHIISTSQMNKYNHIWFPDDDILIDGNAVNQMFEIANKYDLRVCQPALTPDSYFSFLELISVRSFKLRYTAFIEVMAPCIHIDVISEIYDLFIQSPSGFGLDMIWGRLKSSGMYNSAVLDCISMRHTRPVGSVLAKTLKQKGGSTKNDYNVVNNFINYKRVKKLNYAAVLHNDKLIKGKFRISLICAKSWYQDRHEFKGNRNFNTWILRIIKRHIIYGLRMDTLIRKK